MATGAEIAVVGISGRFPGAKNVAEFWTNLKTGHEAIKPATNGADVAGQANSDATAHWVEINSLLPDVDMFDASFFGFNPREAEMLDPQHRIFLESAWHAIEDAGYQAGDRRRHVGVFAGAALSGYIFSQVSEGDDLLQVLPAMIANDRDYLATRASYKMNFSGPSVTVQCACSTSLVAIHLACQSLIAGECDAALAGGVSVAVPRMDRYYYLPGALLSPDGRCRAFDAKARGTAFAEGVGVVFLMRLEDALRENHSIYAVILGSAVNNDAGLKAGYTAPSIEGQVQVVRQAQAVAGVAPSDISYIEAHGTGTVLGDAVELASLSRVFRASTSDVGICGLGSVKTNIGHLSTAAGVAGFIKTVLALKHNLIPPSLNFEQPNPDLDVADSPFFINMSLRPWKSQNGKPLRAGVSSFGVGGTNAHVVLEEPPAAASSESTRTWHALPLSAASEATLARAAAGLKNHLTEDSGSSFADIVYTQQTGRRAFPFRRVVICSDRADAIRCLESVDSERVFSRKVSPKPVCMAYLFPGQGTQHTGMGAELYTAERVFRDSVDTCCAQLQLELGVDFRGILYPAHCSTAPPTLDINATALAQPALFVTQYALAKLLESWGIRPAMMIGHSVGEYAAACLSGVLSLEDALRLVAARARLMQSMPPGCMLPMLPPEVNVAAVNAPEQCVVSGEPDAISRLETELTRKGISCRRLRTSHAFHSAMMDPILEAFAAQVARVQIHAADLPYISNVTGGFISTSQTADPHYWAQQIRQPVLFSKGIQTMLQGGATLFLEVGPGRSLSTLIRRSATDAQAVATVHTLDDARGASSECFSLTRALGKLWTSGVVPDWKAMYNDEQRQLVSLPTYPFERRRYWIESKAPDKAVGGEKKNRVVDWFYTPGWKRIGSIPAAPAKPLPLGKCVLILTDRFGIGQIVAAKLAGFGADVVLAHPANVTTRIDASSYSVDPQDDAAYAQLISELSAEGRRPDHIVHLSSLSAAVDPRCDAEVFRSSQAVGLFALLRLWSALAAVRGMDRVRFDVIANGCHDVIGDEPIVSQNATLLAFCKVLPQEQTNVACRAIDVVIPDTEDARIQLADSLAQYVAGQQEETLVAIRNGFRWVQRFDSVDFDAAKAPPVLKQNGVYLITGGLGRIGLTLARYLAVKCQARLVLTTRSPFPDKSDWPAYLERGELSAEEKRKLAELLEVEKAGGQAFVMQANVASEEDMLAVRQFVEEKFGKLDGVIFGAGRTSLDRNTFQETRPEECESHFETKAYGLMVLEKVLNDRPLDFCIVLSSLSTILGGLSHLAYSASNQFADALVRRRNRLRPDRWSTVNWDAWRFDEPPVGSSGMAAALTRLAMQPLQGVEAFDVLLSMPLETQVIISTGDLNQRLKSWTGQMSAPAEKRPQASSYVYARPDLDTPYADPEGDLEQRLADIWKGALGLGSVGRDDDFFELGGNSLVAIQILGRLRQAFNIDFPIDRALDATTVRKAAALLDSLLTEKVVNLTEEEAVELLKKAQSSNAL
jgi:acyl transferase domain-containing protein/acyl carrier protein